VEKLDHRHKRRADHHLEDEELVAHLKSRISLALKPMIKRAFQFEVTRVERFMVACYDASEGGHFRAHRDNTTKGTAPRRFAVTINLNADDYEAGDLCFPEFGSRTYRAPTGGAVVFSCSLLHEARPVTKGKRFAFLPFLYDHEAARIREQNLAFVAPELQRYRSGLTQPA
jgi:predicted 2-oxoglutarate/Fe(II)-dependent dioxygenase YbiX